MPTTVRHALAAALTGAALISAAACGGTGGASAANLTQGDLVSALASQLSAGSALSYTATYQLTGGKTATIARAQRPARAAFSYPGGSLIVTTAATTRCQHNECTSTDPDTTAAAALTGTPMTSPEAVLAMLNAAALDPQVIATQHDTTVAGRHATCLDLREVAGTPAADFNVCVTSEGALASFAATINGTRADQALTSYSDRVTSTAFEVPASAKLTVK